MSPNILRPGRLDGEGWVRCGEGGRPSFASAVVFSASESSFRGDDLPQNSAQTRHLMRVSVCFLWAIAVVPGPIEVGVAGVGQRASCSKHLYGARYSIPQWASGWAHQQKRYAQTGNTIFTVSRAAALRVV